MAEASADKSKDKNDKNENEDMAEWERRLVEGDLPEDFLAVTEPQSKVQENQRPATGLLVDIPTVTASNAKHEEAEIPPETTTKRKHFSELLTVTLIFIGEFFLAGEIQDDIPNEPKKPLSTEESDHALAMKLQRQLDLEESGGQQPSAEAAMVTMVPANVYGRLTVTVAEARLARNYGMTRMDPYCRLRIGHSVYETPTAANGSREPKWNKTFHVYLLKVRERIPLLVPLKT